MQSAADPVKVFDRTPNLQGAQIISYRVSPDDKWSVLIGITAGAPERCAFVMGGGCGLPPPIQLWHNIMMTS